MKDAGPEAPGEGLPRPGSCLLFAHLLGAIPLLPNHTELLNGETSPTTRELSAPPLDCRFDSRKGLLLPEFLHTALGWYPVDIQLIPIKFMNRTISVFTSNTFGSIPLISFKFIRSSNTFYLH